MSTVNFDMASIWGTPNWFRDNVVGWDREDHLWPDVKRVVIFSAFNEAYLPLAALARKNWAAYARRHNYALRLYVNGFHTDASRAQTYGDKNKHFFFFDLRGDFDAVMFLDIDSLFVNMEVAIESLLHNRFLWTYGEGGPQSGLWIARTDDLTEQHLRYAYEYAARENNVRHGRIEPNGISDQDALTRLMHVPPFRDTFGWCKPMENVGLHYPDTKEANPWVITCRGGSVQDKLDALSAWSERGSQKVNG